MSAPAELPPADPSGDVPEIIANGLPRSVVIGGETILFPDPGNFPWVLEAYLCNRYGDAPGDNYIRVNQKFLAERPVGRMVSKALDDLWDDDRGVDLIHQTFVKDQLADEYAYRYAQVIKQGTQYLAEGFDDAVFRDPWAFEDAA